jgi:hypothetical protein
MSWPNIRILLSGQLISERGRHPIVIKAAP